VDIVKKISTLYGTPQSADTLTQLSLLNEPTLWISDQIKTVTRQFYQDAYQVARHPWGSLNKTDWTIIIHDGFQRQTYWNDFMTEAQGYEKVWIDDHYYQAFGKEDFGISAEEHMRVSQSLNFLQDKANNLCRKRATTARRTIEPRRCRS
jgi:aryl-phospho-beta-D-glucosidase BglC (GH1 family)